MYEFAENQCENAAFVCAGRRGRRPLQGADKNLKLLDEPEFVAHSDRDTQGRVSLLCGLYTMNCTDVLRGSATAATD